MAQLPCIGVSWPLTKPPFGSCVIYFHHGGSFQSTSMSCHSYSHCRKNLTLQVIGAKEPHHFTLTASILQIFSKSISIHCGSISLGNLRIFSPTAHEKKRNFIHPPIFLGEKNKRFTVHEKWSIQKSKKTSYLPCHETILNQYHPPHCRLSRHLHCHVLDILRKAAGHLGDGWNRSGRKTHWGWCFFSQKTPWFFSMIHLLQHKLWFKKTTYNIS